MSETVKGTLRLIECVIVRLIVVVIGCATGTAHENVRLTVAMTGKKETGNVHQWQTANSVKLDDPALRSFAIPDPLDLPWIGVVPLLLELESGPFDVPAPVADVAAIDSSHTRELHPENPASRQQSTHSPSHENHHLDEPLAELGHPYHLETNHLLTAHPLVEKPLVQDRSRRLVGHHLVVLRLYERPRLVQLPVVATELLSRRHHPWRRSSIRKRLDNSPTVRR